MASEKMLIFVSRFILVGVVIFLTFSLLTIQKVNFVDNDFRSFYIGAKLLAWNSDNLYDLQSQKLEMEKQLDMDIGLLPFRSTPVTALIYLPLSLFSLLTAYKVFVIISFLVLIGINLHLVKVLGIKNKTLITLFTLLFLPNLVVVFGGQMTSVVYVLFVLIYVYRIKMNAYKSGLLFGLLCIRPQFLLAVPFILILQKNDRSNFVKGFLLTFSLCVLFSTFVVNGFVLDYYNLLIQTENLEFGSDPAKMVSFYYLLEPRIGKVFALIINFVLYFGLVVSFYKKHKISNVNKNTLFSLTVVLPIVFGVHMLPHDLSLLQLPVFLLLHNMSANMNYLILTLIFIGFIILFALELYFITPVILLIASLKILLQR